MEEFCDEADRAHAVEVINSVFAAGEPGSYDAGGSRVRRRYRVDVVPFAAGTGAAERVLLVSRDVTEAWNTAQQRDAMLAELDHRVKNALAMVLALAEQTIARAASLESFRVTFSGRLRSLARTHEALGTSRWSTVSLAEVVRMTVGALGGEHLRLEEGSEDPLLPPDVVTPLSLALHELTTNAIKYGALSTDSGELRISASSETGSVLLLSWVERARQPTPSSSDGLGFRLVRGLVAQELGGTFDMAIEEAERRYLLRIPLGERR